MKPHEHRRRKMERLAEETETVTSSEQAKRPFVSRTFVVTVCLLCLSPLLCMHLVWNVPDKGFMVLRKDQPEFADTFVNFEALTGVPKIALMAQHASVVKGLEQAGSIHWNSPFHDTPPTPPLPDVPPIEPPAASPQETASTYTPPKPAFVSLEDAAQKMSSYELQGYEVEDAFALDGLKLLKNAVYAHHGYRFHNAEMRAFFEKQAWYHSTGADEKTAQSHFSPLERSNVDLLQRMIQGKSQHPDND